MDKQSSDERLLKLIEGSPDARRRQEGQHALNKTLTGAISGKLNFKNLKAWKGFKLKLFDLNRGLIGFAGLISIIFIYSLFSGPAISKSTAAYFSPADAASVSKVISAIQAQGLMRKNILGQDIKRNIFAPIGSKSSAYMQQEGVDLTEQVKDLKLVGIVWSANPEIMIENAKDSRTYLLKKGDTFNSDTIKVKEISRNSATLEILTDSGSKVYEIR
mgnify:CR=1 FL=1